MKEKRSQKNEDMERGHAEQKARASDAARAQAAADKAKRQAAEAKVARSRATSFARAAEAAKINESEEEVYVVQAGDSLSKIAKEVYGDASRWPEILEANKEKIRNPDLIQPGQELVIP